ncbi:MAG: hypothetical protein EBV06_00795 [Planctomycetia bacterium]|nr:hypothetical protein [Planctomycetia bacterium]
MVRTWVLWIGAVTAVTVCCWLPGGKLPPASVPSASTNTPFPIPPELVGVNLLHQSPEQAHAKSAGCIVCHKAACDPHAKDTLRIGCIDCHGGDAAAASKERAHVQPRFPQAWRSSANPVRSYTLLNHEHPEFVRFVNPGDLRVAHISCGTVNCHPKEVLQVRKSMMTHGCMLWGAALYNNGAVPSKRPLFGESYSMHGTPLALQTVPPPTPEEQIKKGVLTRLDPLPRFEVQQPGNILRIFERGGRFRSEVGMPNIFEDPGRPILTRLSVRGLGTQNRVDPVFTGLQKTRLLDPTLNFMGTNDHPGDYRSSGCTACHMIYANDRSRVHSGPYAPFGHQGLSHDPDPTIPKKERGHPIKHRFAPANSIPTSQCMVCHIHPGTTVMNSYVGFMWWDEETDGQLIYPKEPKKPTAEESTRAMMSNPNVSSARNHLSDPAFLENLTDINQAANHTQFADFHGHGWAFRAVFRQDRQGRLLDHDGHVIAHVDNAKLQEAMRFQKLPPQERKHKPGVPVHLMDIHMEKGMHCIDCHFVQDMHGNTKLQGEVRAAVEIQCIDCHGTVTARATLRTSGPASYTSSPQGGRDLEALRSIGGRRRFEREGNKIYQNSMVEPGLRWEVPQTIDTITPGNPRYNAKAAMAKTMRVGADGKMEWGGVPSCGEKGLAHANSQMSCIACHSSWNPSCYGCHLPQRANSKTPQLHNEGDVTRNIIEYNFQTLRDEVYMLARDGDVTGNRIGPSRSSCAIHVGSYNGNRESIYVQQQTISACGLSGIAFSTNVPHTVRGRDGTKQCTDCHPSAKNDNNAIMAQLLMQGTNYLNFIGRYTWVGAGTHGLEAVEVTEREEPQAVIGSSLHKLAFPDRFEHHLRGGRKLHILHEHPGKDISEQFFKPHMKADIRSLQARGEYLYAACGEAGLRVFDISFIDHKGFSERIFTAPVSPAGQQFYVRTKDAAAVAAPTTIAPDPTRAQQEENREQKVHPLYGYLYVADRSEGLILVGAGTLLDGNPLNNFIKRDVTFNPDGLLNGACGVTIVGTYAYICCDKGVVVVDIDDPKNPKVTSILGEPYVVKPLAVQVQFRYAFVCDENGVTVMDVTNLDKPRPVSRIKLPDARNIYVARTHAYVAGGKKGLIILDVTNPEELKIDQVFTADGEINDLNDVKLGITYTSEFAYLADGKNGMRVVQLTSPETPGNGGFAPRPMPRLIATYKLPHEGKAYAISKGVDRDRAVDESGNQLAVFGRIGARPLNRDEQRKMYQRDGKLYKVDDDPLSALYRYVKPLK